MTHIHNNCTSLKNNPNFKEQLVLVVTMGMTNGPFLKLGHHSDGKTPLTLAETETGC